MALPAESKATLLITHGRSASNLFYKSMLGGQDTDKVKAMEYNFGTEIVVLIDDLVNMGMESLNEAKQAEYWDLYRERTLNILGQFQEAISEVHLDPVVP